MMAFVGGYCSNKLQAPGSRLQAPDSHDMVVKYSHAVDGHAGTFVVAVNKATSQLHTK